MKTGYVYILASTRNGTLYIGVTSDLAKRIYQHKHDLVEGFTRKYRVHNLVYFEIFAEIADAICRETAIKRWKREWKIALIEKSNPDWRDLYEEVMA